MRPTEVTRVTTVTWVCMEYNSYFKIGPNHKKRGLDCQARQVLFALRTITIFETSVLRLRCTRRGRTLTIVTLLANTGTNIHLNPKDAMMNLVPRPCCRDCIVCKV